MNRTLMAAEIARRTGLTKPQATAALDALGDILVAEAKGRRSVQLGGLFTVDVVHRPRTGRTQPAHR